MHCLGALVDGAFFGLSVVIREEGEGGLGAEGIWELFGQSFSKGEAS